MRPRVIVLDDSDAFPDVLPLEEDFTVDAERVLQLTDERVAQIAGVIERGATFFSRGGLTRAIAETWDDPAGVDHVVSYVMRLDAIYRRSGVDRVDFFASFEAGLGELSHFDEEQRARLIVRTSRWVLEKSGLSRQWKALSHMRRTGAPLDGIKIMCDLRPVFDDEREHVQGMVPLVTVRLDVTDMNGLPAAYETTLTEAQLAELAHETQQAQKKLQVLRGLLTDAKIELPDVRDGGREEGLL